MADWKAQYLNSLRTQLALEQADKALYDRCSHLADSNAALRAEIRALKARKPEPVSTPPPPAPLVGYWRTSSSPVQPSTADTSALAQLRSDFVQSQADRTQLQTTVTTLQAEMSTLKATLTTDTKASRKLSTINNQLSVRLRDREDELKAKAKMLSDVQDENATLNLQLNVMEDEIEKIKKENRDLVDRWMRLKGREAEEMNEKAGLK